ncbi:ArnT family glycosyltransferase [Deefgea rivuli]|uniref:ArnT family glycosyltransferase n=1 Tax=Deefgea rivuli TaxID=400948 RepID=UPI000486308F|nr:glycosyltransferase family 39 protein [Deefgea rivuli]
MAYWNDFLLGFFWSIVLLVLILQFAYRPLHARIDCKLVEKFNGSFEENQIDAQRLLFYLIFLLAVAVRIWDFGAIPAGFNQDGAMAAVDAKALADYGTDRFGMKLPAHFTAWGYGQMSVLLSYLMVPFIKIFGLSIISARIPVLILSLCGMLAAYGFVKNGFGRTTALIAFFLLAINPWHIMQSRWALDCNIFPHFFIIGCYFLTLLHVKRYFLYLSMLSFALCMYSYGIAFLTVPIFLLGIAIYMSLKKIVSVKEMLLSVLTYTLVALPVFLVMIINFLKFPTINTPFFTIPFFPDSVRSAEILFFSPQFATQLSTNFNALLNTTLLQRPDLPWNAIDNFATLYLFSMPLVALGVISVLVGQCTIKDEVIVDAPAIRFARFILLMGGFIALWAGLVVGSVNVNRINIAYYFLIIFSGIGLAQVYKCFKPAFVVTSLIYCVSFILFCSQYFGLWSRDISVYFFDGMGKALQQAAKIDTPKYYITINSQFEGAKATSEILTMFHHQIDAKYFQGDALHSPSAATVSANKYQKSYAERYVYIDPKQVTINPQEAAVYIVAESELKYFDPQFFNITPYQGFSLVVQKSLN